MDDLTKNNEKLEIRICFLWWNPCNFISYNWVAYEPLQKQGGWLEWYLGSGELHGWWNHPNVGRFWWDCGRCRWGSSSYILMVWGVEQWSDDDDDDDDDGETLYNNITLHNQIACLTSESTKTNQNCFKQTLSVDVCFTTCPYAESTCKTQLSPPFSIPYLETTNSSPHPPTIQPSNTSQFKNNHIMSMLCLLSKERKNIYIPCN